MKLLISIVIILLLGMNAYAHETLKLSLLINDGKNREAIRVLMRQFEAENQNIKVQLQEKTNEAYYKWMENWEQTDTDVVWGFAGFQLSQYAKKGSIEPIGDVWNTHKLEQNFASLKDAVSFNGEVYALPISHYQWGFFYKKSLFAKYKIAEPKTWPEFLAACETLKANHITPLGLGTKEPWTAATWFSYLNIRMNGLPFHQQLLAGKQSYKDKKVEDVLLAWKQLIDKGYFLTEHEDLKWRAVLPFVYRDLVGMYLIGSFFSTGVTPPLSDYDFFRFPAMNAKVPMAEEAPADVLFINKNSTHKVLAKKLLEFMSRAESQFVFNESMGTIAPNVNAKSSNNPITSKAVAMLKTAQGTSQYFDRDTSKSMATEGVVILGEFSGKPDVAKAIVGLENARLKHFPQ